MNLIRSVSILTLASAALSAQAIVLNFPDTVLRPYPAPGAETTVRTNRGPLGSLGILSFDLGPGTADLEHLSVYITATSGSITSVVSYFPLPNTSTRTGFYSAEIVTPAIDAVIVDYTISFSPISQNGSNQIIRNISLDVQSLNAVPGPVAALPFALMALKRRRAKRSA